MANFIYSIYLIYSKAGMFRLSLTGKKSILHYWDHSASSGISVPKAPSKLLQGNKIIGDAQVLEKCVYWCNMIWEVQQLNFV